MGQRSLHPVGRSNTVLAQVVILAVASIYMVEKRNTGEPVTFIDALYFATVTAAPGRHCQSPLSANAIDCR